MDVRVLGPVEASEGGRPIALGGGKPRALLALLALNAGSSVSTERLIEGLWDEDPPATAIKLVQVYVSQLRKALAASGAGAEIVTRRRSYELRVGAGAVDAERFERLLAAGAPREALELWRGPPLDDVADEPFAAAEIRRLEELRLAAHELAIEHDLDEGRHRDVVPELEALVAAEPLRERLHALRMLALYRSGRQADALDAYRDARDVLVAQLGIEPGAQLHELHQAILAHDPRIDAPRSALDFPSNGLRVAPASAAVGESRLPLPPNRTIGRAQEIGAVAARLRTGSVRLLTLTGPGGVGKTRLALESSRAAEDSYADGAHFVSLDALTRPEDVPAAIVTTLETIVLAGESPAAAVERFLATKRLLLVLDNFEQLLDAAPFIGALLAACPELTVLATGREPMGLAAEECQPVLPLALPEPGTGEDTETLGAVDAVALFSERARSHDPGFDLGGGNAAVVAEICRRVDGLPLAIELAAARCGLLSPPEIAERLHASLAGLALGRRDAPARHRTLRATIDWSHALLSDVEKGCFARFAVFAGGATVAAAETVTGAELDTVDRLVAKSLFVRHQRARMPTRLGMLETIRGYAGERLATAPDWDRVHERHYRYFLAVARTHATDRALMSAGRAEHLATLDAELDNFHAALAWAVGQTEVEAALELVDALGWYWLMRYRLTEAVDWIDRALSLPGADAHAKLRVGALISRSWCLWPLGRTTEQRSTVTEAEAIARELGDPVTLSQALQTRADHESARGRVDAANTFAEEALHCASAAGDEWEIARASRTKARAASTVSERRARVDTAASLLNEVGNVFDLAYLLNSASYGSLLDGCDRDARNFVERAMPFARELDNPFLWMTLQGNLGLAALLTGDTDAARDAFREELILCRRLVARPVAPEGLLGLAAVDAARGDAQRAARLAGAATAHRGGLPHDAIATRLDAAFLDDARRRCGADLWDAATREGGELSFEASVAYALQEPAAPGPS